MGTQNEQSSRRTQSRKKKTQSKKTMKNETDCDKKNQ